MYLNMIKQECGTMTRYRELRRERTDSASSYALMSQGVCIYKGPVAMKREEDLYPKQETERE